MLLTQERPLAMMENQYKTLAHTLTELNRYSSATTYWE